MPNIDNATEGAGAICALDKPAGAMVKSLDMTNENDRASLRRRLLEKRWPELGNDFKIEAAKALRVALQWATDAKDHRSITGCVKTLAMLEGQNQADEHLVFKAETPKGDTITNNFNGPAQVMIVAKDAETAKRIEDAI